MGLNYFGKPAKKPDKIGRVFSTDSGKSFYADVVNLLAPILHLFTLIFTYLHLLTPVKNALR